ncbi:MAG TPA: galactokinase [Thermoanaerobaculia bacterium]
MSEPPHASGFREAFGRPPEGAGEAHGRVNLIGEHTDYNGGFVLPTAIPQKTRAEVARRADAKVRAASASEDGGRPSEYALGRESRRRGWIDYVQGVTAELSRLGLAASGFDLWIRSTVPTGAGLSSSAALEVSVLRALRDLFGLALDDVSLALAGQRAENDLVGAPVGVMDQMASSLAAEGVALFLDTRSLQYERIPIPPQAEIAVIDSGVRHDHASGDYRKRREECEEAARLLGVRELRDVSAGRLADVETLPEPLNRRARHVVTENARTLQAAELLEGGDVEGVGALMDESHRSLRDDFEVSRPELDTMVALARRDGACLGARMTGAGFGGCAVALVRREDADAFARSVARAYAEAVGIQPSVYLCAASEGASVERVASAPGDAERA